MISVFHANEAVVNAIKILKLKKYHNFAILKVIMRKGFTLIEVLVVIGILAIIFAIVLIAINPRRQFNLANDTQRKSNVTELRKAFIQYFLDYRLYPSANQWSAASCGYPAPDWLKRYIAAVPCDPETSHKYFYQPLDSNCQPCLDGSARCTGFKILGKLANPEDSAIRQAGCDATLGCGVTTPEGDIPNFGMAVGCNVVITPIFLTPTQTPEPTPTINITPIPGFNPNPAFDATRISDLMSITLALEKYKFTNSSYPDCGSGWHDAACLTNPISNLLNQSQVPHDPENGDPYIYITYTNGFCLGAHLGDTSGHLADINCSVDAPLPIYSYRIKERREIILRPTLNPLSEEEKDQRDLQRKTDLQTFTDAMEMYKHDNGHYPNCWPEANIWATTGSGSFFCGGQFTTYSTSYNFDPGGTNPYTIVQWDPGPDGYFRQYCFGAYMDKGSNINCKLDCPVNNYNANYCYFTKNP